MTPPPEHLARMEASLERWRSLVPKKLESVRLFFQLGFQLEYGLALARKGLHPGEVAFIVRGRDVAYGHRHPMPLIHLKTRHADDLAGVHTKGGEWVWFEIPIRIPRHHSYLHNPRKDQT